MKILFLLFAVVFLAFQTQTEATVLEKNEVQEQAQDQVEGEAQDEFMADNDVAEFASPRARGWIRPTVCQIRGGVCRGNCFYSEYPAAWCFSGTYCCKRK